jgi:hypothetical protein
MGLVQEENVLHGNSLGVKRRASAASTDSGTPAGRAPAAGVAEPVASVAPPDRAGAPPAAEDREARQRAAAVELVVHLAEMGLDRAAMEALLAEDSPAFRAFATNTMLVLSRIAPRMDRMLEEHDLGTTEGQREAAPDMAAIAADVRAAVDAVGEPRARAILEPFARSVEHTARAAREDPEAAAAHHRATAEPADAERPRP